VDQRPYGECDVKVRLCEIFAFVQYLGVLDQTLVRFGQLRLSEQQEDQTEVTASYRRDRETRREVARGAGFPGINVILSSSVTVTRLIARYSLYVITDNDVYIYLFIGHKLTQ
jgi:hypothetical protein